MCLFVCLCACVFGVCLCVRVLAIICGQRRWRMLETIDVEAQMAAGLKDDSVIRLVHYQSLRRPDEWTCRQDGSRRTDPVAGGWANWVLLASLWRVTVAMLFNQQFGLFLGLFERRQKHQFWTSHVLVQNQHQICCLWFRWSTVLTCAVRLFRGVWPCALATACLYLAFSNDVDTESVSIQLHGYPEGLADVTSRRRCTFSSSS